MRMAFGGTVAVALIFMCSVRAVVAQAPAYAPAPGPSASNSTEIVEYYNVQSDVDALRSILESWTKTNTNLNSLLPGWSLEHLSPCVTSFWLGIICYVDPDTPYNYTLNEKGQNVTGVPLLILGITISNTELAGDLPPAFGNLSGIYFIYITGNSKLTGPIPKELEQLPNLEALDLHGNNLTGSIPPELGNIRNLIELDLSGNQLTGNIPGNLGNASYLYTLKLSQNLLTGTIPATSSSTGDGPGLSHLQYLMSIELMENRLTGPLPDLWNLTILTTLNVSHNQLSGAVVIDNIFNLSAYNITTLDLSSNNFAGAFPDLSKLSNSAIQLGLSDNSFDASAIPSWLSNFKGLKTLDMANNSLYGSVPTFLVDTTSLPQLQYLNLDRNSLNGTLDLSKVFPRSTGPPTLKSVNLTTNNITAVDYDTNMMLEGSPVVNVRFMLDGNPFCTDLERQNMSAAVYYFCRNSTTGKTVIYLADKYRKAIISVAVILCTACLLIAAMALFLCWRNRRDKKRLRMQIQHEFAKSDVQPTLYSYSELRAATRDFNPELKVGEGAFGVVYKGVQPDGGELAVKHLVGRTQQGIDEFLNEVVLITGVRHRNLVKLKGCCLRDDKRLLVYEFVENNNLAEVLFEGKGDHDMNWGVRYNICLGVALGLQYLHENALPRIIHRDIKAPNILLDKNLSAKIADFGLARLFPDEESHISTLHIAGTTGYLAPEYASRGQLTEKADVFSYGVLVLEIVSGRRNIDHKLSVEEIYIVEHAWRCQEEGRLLDIVDNTLDIKGREAEVERVINIALLCLSGTGHKRPSMTRVVSLLKGEAEMEAVIREAYNSRQLYASFLKTVQSDPDVTIDIKRDQNLKDFENKPLLEGESSSRESFPSSLGNSRFVELTSLTPR